MAQIKPLTPELQKIAETELGEIKSRINSDLQLLKDWLRLQPHLKARIDDQFLVQFLRGSKHSLEKAKEKIDYFYTLKTKFPEEFNVNDVTNERFRNWFRSMFIALLPTPLNNTGPRIIVFRTNDDLLNGLYTIEDTHTLLTAMLEITILEDPYACINGFIVIIDLKNVTSNFILKYTPSVLKKEIMFIEKCLPFRYKAVYYVNAPSIFHRFFNTIYPILPNIIKQRVTFCDQNMNNLLKCIPKQYLPLEYGGENGSIEQIDWSFDKKFDEYRDYFKENINYGTNEKLRPALLPTPLNNTGPRIIVFRTNDDLLNGLYTIEDTHTLLTAMLEITILEDPYACINGFIVIIDLKNVTSNFILKYTPSVLKKEIMFIEKCLPFRYKAVYYVNAPSIFHRFFNTIYPILPNIIKQRVTFCDQNMNNLLKCIPKQYLPLEYGGENGSIEQIDWSFDKKFDEYRDYFKENINYGTNEKLRPGKPIDFDTMFGLSGTFRKLDVD